MAIIGYNGTLVLNQASEWIATKFNSPESGIITSIFFKIYQSANAGDKNYQVGIYSDNAGAIGTLLNNSSSYLLSGGFEGWIEIAIPSTSLISGNNYWLVCQREATIWAQFYYVAGGTDQEKYKTSITFPFWDTPNPATDGSYDRQAGIYANITSNTITKTILSDIHFLIPDIQKTILSDIEFIKRKFILSDVHFFANDIQKTISSDVHFLVEGVQKTILSDIEFVIRKTILSDIHFFANDVQKTILSDIHFKVFNIQKTILSDIEFVIFHESKYIHSNYMYVVTDTNPAKLIKINIGVTPPTYDIHILNASGEDLNYSKELVINHNREQLYASFDSGNVAKIDLNNPNSRESIYVGEDNQLITITHNPDYLVTFVADNDLNSLFLIDEATYANANTDFRFLTKVIKTIKNILAFVFKKTINTDFRFLLKQANKINTDFRFLTASYEEIPLIAENLISEEDFVIKINNVEIDDFIQSSIKITLNVDEQSDAQFILTRKHDDVNNPTEITNNNIIQIFIKDTLLFDGKINKLDCSSEEESVSVYALGDAYAQSKTLISLPLVSLNEQLHPYHILIDDININNPYINPLELNPEYYKGISISLGSQEEEFVYRLDSKYISMTAEQFEDFIPDQNYTYFWYASGFNFITGWSFSRKYIGTSLASLYSDTYEIGTVSYKKQRIFNNLKLDLGSYLLGVAPYKTITTPNGKYIPKFRWEDKGDGLYDVYNNNYNFINYAKKVAASEYQKIGNINGSILPRTSASISLTIDAFLYYGFKLLNRINIVNTTLAGIYSNNNGFPLSIKSMVVDSGSMRVSLELNNEWSKSELDEIDSLLPTEPQIMESGSSKVDDKYDLAKQDFID
ncbi:MAG: hypothetical protein V1901_03855 [Patescibacteria group bacterium]